MVASVAEEPRHAPDRRAEQAKTLVGALNLLSRNLPLPPDVFRAVSSIYHGDEPSELQEMVEGGGAPASAESIAVRALSLPFLSIYLNQSVILVWI